MIFAEWESLFAVVVEVLQLQKLLALEQARAGRSIIVVMSVRNMCSLVFVLCRAAEREERRGGTRAASSEQEKKSW